MRDRSEDLNPLFEAQDVFPSPLMSVNQHLSRDSFFPRSQPEYYPAASVAFNSAVLYSEAPFTSMFGDSMSPSAFHEEFEMTIPSSSLSTDSGPSEPSSVVGSPRSNHEMPQAVREWPAPQCVSLSPGIVGQGDFFSPGEYSFSNSHMEELNHFDFSQPKTFIDETLLHPPMRPVGIRSFDSFPTPPPPSQSTFPGSASNSPELKAGSLSPYPGTSGAFTQFGSPYLAPKREQDARRASHSSSSEQQSDSESKEKQQCPHPNCGRKFKDLRAHMLTHQNERPEKCPIQTCEYHVKGFARKYDKNRHTLTHYKGNMVCGFCPGSGSPAEKSFNRADVFKRHLTALHGVEQTPPNSRKKAQGGTGANGAQKLATYAPDATGKCSTCSETFSNAQEFYEHLDDCVLRVVQLEDPAEAVNASRLAEVENDEDVKQTLEKNKLPTVPSRTAPSVIDDDDDDDMDDEEGGESPKDKATDKGIMGSPKKAKANNMVNGIQKSRGMTYSRGGVPFTGKARSRRSRQNYPTSWGFDKGQMTMRKRVMTVFEGPRRLAKDDMMLSTEHEVRLKLSDGKAYVTDLDVQTLKRAEGFLNATEEEKGPWISDDLTDEQLKQLQCL